MPDLMADEIDEDEDLSLVREAELRQLLEGKRFRQIERGEEPIDVDVELERILAEESRGL